MLDDGSDLVRRKPVRRRPAERSTIVAETYQPGATVAGVAPLGNQIRRIQLYAAQLDLLASPPANKLPSKPLLSPRRQVGTSQCLM
jgi:transposase-like protein